ncbi:DNA adenine methylase [Lacrimispora amygdalina]|uniref:DNA adenine methylase n=1 Tax=Lacrimispora amygdalina TaxID=253257 RepID=UPI0014791130|nr:DNA adenine methylase [Clostridium indicum]
MCFSSELMQYFGGKQRIANEIIKTLTEYADKDQTLVEPFVGGCNVISKMRGERYCYDINEYLIEMYKAIQNGWIPPKCITKEQYDHIKENKDYDKALTGFVGIGCSYSGKWFGGYAKNNTGRNYCLNAHNSIMKQKDDIMGINFLACDYRDLVHNSCLIYCDPPYKGTTQYSISGKFDTSEFWDTIRKWSKNNTVIVSEYTAPDDFRCIKKNTY